MSQRDGYRHGVPCWVAAVHPAVRAADLGGRILAPPSDIPVGRSGVLADPQGASFSVSRSPVPG